MNKIISLTLVFKTSLPNCEIKHTALAALQLPFHMPEASEAGRRALHVSLRPAPVGSVSHLPTLHRGCTQAAGRWPDVLTAPKLRPTSSAGSRSLQHSPERRLHLVRVCWKKNPIRSVRRPGLLVFQILTIQPTLVNFVEKKMFLGKSALCHVNIFKDQISGVLLIEMAKRVFTR